MSGNFILDARLQADSLPIADLPLCHLRLMNNARFPWVLLIPRVDNAREFTDLDESGQQQLMREITQTSRALQTLTQADKMNIGALGNMVPQLHIHIIARFQGDATWPNPVWGTGGEPYAPAAAADWVAKIAAMVKK